MPKVEVILERARSLQPCLPFLDRDPEVEEKWKGTGHGAKFSLLRLGATFGNQEVEQLCLTLRGLRVGQDALRVEFIKALGEPESEISARKFRYPHTIVWPVSVLDK